MHWSPWSPRALQYAVEAGKGAQPLQHPPPTRYCLSNKHRSQITEYYCNAATLMWGAPCKSEVSDIGSWNYLEGIWQSKAAQELLWNLIITALLLIPCHLSHSCTERLNCTWITKLKYAYVTKVGRLGSCATGMGKGKQGHLRSDVGICWDFTRVLWREWRCEHSCQ